MFRGEVPEEPVVSSGYLARFKVRRNNLNLLPLSLILFYFLAIILLFFFRTSCFLLVFSCIFTFSLSFSPHQIFSFLIFRFFPPPGFGGASSTLGWSAATSRTTYAVRTFSTFMWRFFFPVLIMIQIHNWLNFLKWKKLLILQLSFVWLFFYLLISKFIHLYFFSNFRSSVVDFETKSLREVRERIALSGLQDGYTYADKYVIEIFCNSDSDFHSNWNS